MRIIHGKGKSSEGKLPVLKGKVNAWLRQWDQVLAFCSARPNDGGTGAVYVLLSRGRLDLVRAVEKVFSIKNRRAPSTAKPDCRYIGNPFATITATSVGDKRSFSTMANITPQRSRFLQVFCGFGEGRLRSAESCRKCIFDSSVREGYFVDTEIKKAGCTGRLKNFSLSVKHFPSFA